MQNQEESQKEEGYPIKDAFQRIEQVWNEYGNYSMETLEEGPSQLKFGYKQKEFKECVQKMIREDGKISLILLFLFNKHEAQLGLFYNFLSIICQLVLPMILEGMIQWMFEDDSGLVGGIGYLATLIAFIVLKDYFSATGSYYLRLNSCELRNQIKVRNGEEVFGIDFFIEIHFL